MNTSSPARTVIGPRGFRSILPLPPTLGVIDSQTKPGSGVYAIGAVDLGSEHVLLIDEPDQLHVVYAQPDLRPVSRRHVAPEREQARVVAQREQVEHAPTLEEREMAARADQLDLRDGEPDLHELFGGRIGHDHDQPSRIPDC